MSISWTVFASRLGLCLVSYLALGLVARPSRARPPTADEVKARAVCPSCDVVSSPVKLELPETGVEAYSSKVFDRSKREMRVMTLRGDGGITTEEVLRAGDDGARRARDGVVWPGLARKLRADQARLAAARQAQPTMPVVIWRRVEVQSVDKLDVMSSPGNTAAYEADVKAALAVNLPPIKAFLDARGRKYEVDDQSPIVTAHLTADEVLELGRLNRSVAWIDYHRPVVPQSTAWYGDTGVPFARQMVNGGNISVCVVEGSHPEMCGASCNPSGSPAFVPCNSNLRLGALKCQSGSGDRHIENVSNIISSFYPYLPGVTNAPVHISDFQTHAGLDDQGNHVWYPTEWGLNLFNAWNWCREKGALAINYSMSYPDPRKFQGPVSNTWPPPDGDYTASDMVVDWQVMQPPYPVIAMAAGNDGHGDQPWVKNKAHNAIIVGAIDDKTTAGNFTDDVVWYDPPPAPVLGGSSWRNPHGYSNHGDHELPHIVAPGKCIDMGGRTCTATQPLTGTSYAAPQIVGAAALMMDRNPSLKGWPEVIKGILLATAGRHVPPDQPLPPTGVGTAAGDRKSGAGALDTGLAVTAANMPLVSTNAPAQIYARGSLPITGHQGATGPWGPFNIRGNNRRQRVVLTWTTWVGGCTNSSQFCDFDVPPDLDLRVVDKQTQQRLCSSLSFDSTWEACEFNAVSGRDYEAWIYKAGDRQFVRTNASIVWVDVNPIAQAPQPAAVPASSLNGMMVLTAALMSMYVLALTRKRS